MPFVLSALHVFPIKSGAPLPVDCAEVQARGLAGDRRWMVVDDDGRFVTGREEARLTLLRAQPLGAGGGLRLDAPGQPSLRVAAPERGSRRAVTVWKNTVEVRLADASVSGWLTAFLGRCAHLAYMDEACLRQVDLAYARAGDIVSFADAYPLLLIGQAALDDLNARLARPVPMLRFRPNLVVAGTAPYAEDAWRRIRIGGIEFDLVKPCTRCVFTTVDFERGERDAEGEPLRTLIGYRRTPGGVTFGQNVIARGVGTLRVGDAVEVLESA